MALAAVESVPDDHNLDISVELLQGDIDASGTARLRITTTNTGAERVVSVGSALWCSLFNRQAGGSDDPPGLWLHHPGRADNIERDGDRWVAVRPPDQPRAYPDIGCLPSKLSTEGRISNEYVVWDDYREPGYLHPDTYRWEAVVKTGKQGSSDRTSFRWGFSLDVSVP